MSALDPRLPDWFRNNYDADKVRRVCLTWRPGATCPDCGHSCLHADDVWACYDCGGGGVFELSDSDSRTK